MRLTTATGWGTIEWAAPLPRPSGRTPRPAQAAQRAVGVQPPSVAAAMSGAAATPEASSLVTLSAVARREARYNSRALAALWLAGWLALVLALTL